MIILFDVGNSNIKIGLSNGKDVKQMIRLKSEIHKTADEYYLVISNFLKGKNVEGAIISSVVPELTTILTVMCKEYFNIEPLVFGQKLKTGLMIIADNPREVGADLIADGVGSTAYGSNVLVVDLGTATKFIYVQNKIFKGCTIAPGVQSSLNSLVSSTALLPKIEIKAPKKVLGNNTITCMQSGVTFSYASMIDGMIQRIKQEEGLEELTVVATGGLAKAIVPLCFNEIITDEFLTLKGILQVYLKNNN